MCLKLSCVSLKAPIYQSPVLGLSGDGDFSLANGVDDVGIHQVPIVCGAYGWTPKVMHMIRLFLVVLWVSLLGTSMASAQSAVGVTTELERSTT